MKIKIETNKKIWQVGAGDGSRDYSKILLDFGIILVGPGNPGIAGSKEANNYYKLSGKKDYGKILKDEVNKKDWVILRKGRKVIKAIGKISSEYKYYRQFEEVEGWDLQHTRHVEWYIPETDIIFDNLILSMSAFSECKKIEVREKIKNSIFNKHISSKTIENLKIPNELTIDDITYELINKGIKISDSENISNTIRRIIYLVNWYIKNDYNSSEHEIRSFLILPLLFALGWSEQKIKIEYNNIDIALFSESFIGDYKKSPEIIIEAKNFYNGLSFTREYASKYTNKFPKCNTLITTNGYMYLLFEKVEGNFVQKSYLNLLNLREHHYLQDKVSGALDCLLKMSNLI